MVYVRVSHKKFDIDNIKNTASCPECHSKNLMLARGRLVCRNCDTEIGRIGKSNKYGAQRTEMNGKVYDSKFEAQVAAELEVEKKLGQIKDYDTQYRIEGYVYDENGNKAFSFRHKVDFRVHNLDGSFTLIEAKGVETVDYKWRRKLLETVWLPANPDHDYKVVFQKDWKTGGGKWRNS